MFDTQAIQHGFGQAASLYDAHAHLQHHVRSRCIALGKRYWPANAHIIDAGCGTGTLARMSQWRITGVDLAFGMCVKARQDNPMLVNADVVNLPFADSSFDGLFSSLMLQWVSDPVQAWQEMARVIKPEGKCVVSTLVCGTLYELEEAFTALDDAPHVSAFMEAHEVLSLAAEAGFGLLVAEQARLVDYYPDTIALMRALQAIGASNKASGRRKGLMTPSQLSRAEQAYEKRFGDPRGLPATWQVLTMAVEKQ